MKTMKNSGWAAMLMFTAILLAWQTAAVAVGENGSTAAGVKTDPVAGGKVAATRTVNGNETKTETVPGYVHDLSGDVSIVVGKIAHRAKKFDAIARGAYVKTGDKSSAVLKFEDGEVVAMQANSTLLVREYRYVPEQADKSKIVFSMFQGGMRFITGLIGQRNKNAFRLSTPNMTIGIRGTEFLVVASNGAATYSQVISGSIVTSNAAGATVLTAGQTGVTPSAAALTTLMPAAPTGIFSEVAAISVPEAVPVAMPVVPVAAPAPVPVPVPVPALPASAIPAENLLTEVPVESAAGGAAAGGAEATTATAAVATGVSGTAIAIGVGVAAGVAALVTTTSTTNH